MKRSAPMLRTVTTLGVLLALVVAGGVRAEDADEAIDGPEDAAVARCLTACETTHDGCRAAAKSKVDACERQKRTCEAGCNTCRSLYGPQVVYCVQDCEACRARLPASCDEGGEAECDRALQTCLDRCGP